MPKLNITQVTWPTGKGPGWSHADTGMNGGRYGFIEHAVITDGEGNPLFDRAIVHEGPHVYSWMFARRPDGEVVSGLLKERRDTAAPADGHSTLDFMGPPRGFRDEGETPEQAALREIDEETGKRLVLGTWDLGEFITNETCTGTFSPLVVVEVDYDYYGEINHQHGEKILSCGFYTRGEIEHMIARGFYDGALCNSFALIAPFQKFCIMLDAGHFDNR